MGTSVSNISKSMSIANTPCRKPAVKASPAPVVSTTSTSNAGTVPTWVGG